MATTGEKYPTLGESVSESPWSDNAWTTPTNIYSDNAATANVTATSYDSPDQTYVLKATGFDFSEIPDGSKINGVTCRVNAWYRSGQGAGSLDLCQLLNISKAKIGTNQCATPVALTTTNTTIITKGGAADQWGNTLTAAWVKNASFGVALGMLATAANADVDIDYVTLEVDYTPPVSLSGTATFAGGLSGQVKPNRKVDGVCRAESAGDAEAKALRGIDGLVDPLPSRVVAVLTIEGQIELIALAGEIGEMSVVELGHPYARRIVRIVPISPRLGHLPAGG